MDLYLRRVGRDAYRVILKRDETEYQIGSISFKNGLEATQFWAWGIDTVLPMRSHVTEGHGIDRKDCMKKFRAAWEAQTSEPGWLEEFLSMKRKRQH